MESITVVFCHHRWLDLAKHIFQFTALMLRRVVVAKAIRRNKLLEFFASLVPCLVGLG